MIFRHYLLHSPGFFNMSSVRVMAPPDLIVFNLSSHWYLGAEMPFGWGVWVAFLLVPLLLLFFKRWSEPWVRISDQRVLVGRQYLCTSLSFSHWCLSRMCQPKNKKKKNVWKKGKDTKPIWLYDVPVSPDEITNFFPTCGRTLYSPLWEIWSKLGQNETLEIEERNPNCSSVNRFLLK